MNRYEGAVCPVCGQAFTPADDVVVCPSCGTPHHRGCWMHAGHCANAEKHAAGYTWREAPREPEDVPEQAEPGVTCPRCGMGGPKDTLFCPRCGQPLGAPPAEGHDPQGQHFIGDVSPEDAIENISMPAIAEYVRTGVQSYVPKFFRMDRTKKKISWNWAAFFFSPFWFFYRKLYAAGAVVISLLLALSIAFSGPIEAYMEAYYQLLTARQSQEALANLNSTMPMAVLFLAIQLVLHIVCALIADRLYFKKMMRDLHDIQKRDLDGSVYRVQMIRKGGSSLLFGFSAYLLYDLAYMLIMQLLAKFL